MRFKNERMARCLNVLREAANEMFNPAFKMEGTKDIDYYEKNKEEEKDDSQTDLVYLN